MLDLGTNIERYTVEAVLGEGGMAIVYRVRHTHLKTVHALKVLTLNHARLEQRFLQEAQVQAALRHPNIVPVTDFFLANDSPALLMELVEGPTLEQWIRAARPSLDEAEAVFRGVVAGVAHAHAQGLVHRDLKPANVLLARDDDRLVPKVTDFGLVKLLETPGTGRTRTGMTMGTPAYMAPEQIRHAGKVDARADLFSLGCILYELVCGRPPFAHEDLFELLSQVASGRYTPPGEIVPDLPERVAHTIAACLRVDPELRIPTCEIVLGALDGQRWEPAVSAEPTGPAAVPSISAGATPTDPAASVAAPPMVATTLTASVAALTPAPASPAPASPAPEAPALAAPTPAAPALVSPMPPAPAPSPAPVRGRVLAVLAGTGVIGVGAMFALLLVAFVALGGATGAEVASADEASALAARGSDEDEDEDEGAEDAANGPTYPMCEAEAGEPGELIGYVQVNAGYFKYPRGSVWTTSRTRRVYDKRPMPEENYRLPTEVLCMLPAGARVHMQANPIAFKTLGYWVPLHRGHVDLPATSEGSAAAR